jgi:hypothetical protein
MDMMQWMQEVDVAQWSVALLMLPWAAVVLMQSFSFGTRQVLDDNFGLRAGAASRWCEWNAEAGLPSGAVLIYRARRRSRAARRVHRARSRLSNRAGEARALNRAR